jgi:hypothetical protein
MSARPSLYSDIHKGLRRELFNLAQECGRTDPEHEGEVAALCDRLATLRGFLHDHAGHEEHWVEPLLNRHAPALARELAAAHQELHERLAEVEKLFAAWRTSPQAERVLAGAGAYAALSTFVAHYAAHMAREEGEAMPALLAAMTDDQVTEIAVKLRASIPPPRLGQFLAFMLPAMNVVERTRMFEAMKAAAPPEVVAGVGKLAASVLNQAEWAAVKARAGL